MGAVAGPAGGYAGAAQGAAGNGIACGVGPGEDCTACGVGCGGNGGGGAMSYVGGGQGSYTTETTYKYVGFGGDYGRPRRDFTCILCPLSLLLLIPLLWWLLSGTSTSLPYDCEAGFEMWESTWSLGQQEFCCSTMGRGCATTAFPATTPMVPVTPFPTPPPTPPLTPPPTPPAAPSGPVDPFNCAVDAENTWAADKKAWCCRIHHRGCPPTAPPPQPILPAVQPAPVQPILPPMQPTLPPRPADPYDCNAGFANWQAGWSVAKKEWCCRVHGKGCANQGGFLTSSEPYDCDAGFANWQAGWSIPKKSWCCANKGKGCPPAAGGCA